MRFIVWALVFGISLAARADILIFASGGEAPTPPPPAEPGTWSELSGTQALGIMDPNNFESDGSSNKVFGAWSGFVWDEGRNQMVVFGGGHADSSNNGVYAFDLTAQSWSALLQYTVKSYPCRSPVSGQRTYQLSSISGTFQAGEPLVNQSQADESVGDVCSEHTLLTSANTTEMVIQNEVNRPADGNTIRGVTSGATAVVDKTVQSPRINAAGEPTSRHTYGNMAFIPALDGRADDLMLMHGGSLDSPGGGFGNDTWLFNFTTNTWRDLGADLPNNPGTNQLRCAYDPTDDAVYCLVRSFTSSIAKFDPDTEAWSFVGLTGAFPSNTSVDAMGNLVLRGSGQRELWGFGNSEAWKIDLGALTIDEVTDTGATEITDGNKRIGCAWVPPRHVIACHAAHNGNNAPDPEPKSVFEFDPESFVWEKQTPATGGPNTDNSLVGLNNLAFSQQSGVLVAAVSAFQNVFTYTPPDEDGFTAIAAMVPWRGSEYPCQGGNPGNCKHSRIARSTVDGYFYHHGGDYTPSAGAKGENQSGRNEMYRLDSRYMWWDLVHDYCPTDNRLIYGHSDESGWWWDPTRNVFWAAPGFQNGTGSCVISGSSVATGGDTTTLIDAGATFVSDGVEAGFYVIDPLGEKISYRIVSVDSETQLTTEMVPVSWDGLDYKVATDVKHRIMSFDPAAAAGSRWSVLAKPPPPFPYTGGNKGYYVIDPATGILWATDNGPTAKPLDLDTGNFLSGTGSGFNHVVRDSLPMVFDGKLWIVSFCNGDEALHIFDFTTETWSLGATPPSPAGTCQQDLTPLYHAGIDRIVLHDTDAMNILHLYDPNTDTWDTNIPFTIIPSGSNFSPRQGGYDPVSEKLFFWGNDSNPTQLFEVHIR